MGIVAVSLIKALLRNFPDLVLFTGATIAHLFGLRWFLETGAARRSGWLRWAAVAETTVSAGLFAFGFLLSYVRVLKYFRPWWATSGRGGVFVWAFASTLMIIAFGLTRMLRRATEQHLPSRRLFLRTVEAAILAAPAAAMGYGVFIERKRVEMREQRITIPGLHPDLDGLRIVQLTDIHLSSFLPESVLAHAVDMANETRAKIALVTGDLISFEGDPVDTCLNHLARLRSDAGTFGCMGNHEIYAGTQEYTAEQGARLGMRFLRDEAALLRFGAADLNLAGVDYQRMHGVYLRGSERMIVPGTLNMLLSHNPDVFPVAAEQGWNVTIGGHTHGGQVSVEILHQDLNVARFFTPYVDGLYRRGDASIFVSRGIGTIGMPVRLGAPPEVALITLCRT